MHSDFRKVQFSGNLLIAHIPENLHFKHLALLLRKFTQAVLHLSEQVLSLFVLQGPHINQGFGKFCPVGIFHTEMLVIIQAGIFHRSIKISTHPCILRQRSQNRPKMHKRILHHILRHLRIHKIREGKTI